MPAAEIARSPMALWCTFLSGVTIFRPRAMRRSNRPRGNGYLLLDGDEWLPEDAAQTWPAILADPLFEGATVLNAQVGPPDSATVFKRVLFRNHQNLRFAVAGCTKSWNAAQRRAQALRLFPPAGLA
jgi:hypothetical protein